MNNVVGSIAGGDIIVGILRLLIVLNQIIHASTLPERAFHHNSDAEEHESFTDAASAADLRAMGIVRGGVVGAFALHRRHQRVSSGG